MMRRVPFPEKTIAQTNRPHAYFKVMLAKSVWARVTVFIFQIQVDTDEPFRLVIELRPDMAPKVDLIVFCMIFSYLEILYSLAF